MEERKSKSNGKINALLQELVSKSESRTGLLVTKEGVCLAEAGDVSYLNVTAMAALVAGMFAATREVAGMVGEKQFSILLQQGENRHIHISLLGDATMMVVIFDDYQRIGRVRHEARRNGELIAEAIAETEAPPPEAEAIATPQFKEYALNLIDRIFETR